MPRPSPVRGIGPRTPVGDAARPVIAARLADVLAFEPALQRGLDPDVVHDIRVACRRLRAALNVFRSVTHGAEATAEVKRLQDALGEVRDRHVQLEWLADKPSAAQVSKKIQRELGASGVRLQAALDRFLAHGVPSVRTAAEGTAGEGPFAGREVRRRIDRRIARLDREIGELLEAPDAIRAHQVRKTLKKLRYEFEVIGPALPDLVEGTLALFKPLQDLLGTLHDHDVRLQLLSSGRHAGLASLRRKVGDERDRLMDQTLSAMVRFKDERIPAALKAMLKKATQQP